MRQPVLPRSEPPGPRSLSPRLHILNCTWFGFTDLASSHTCPKLQMQVWCVKPWGLRMYTADVQCNDAWIFALKECLLRCDALLFYQHSLLIKSEGPWVRTRQLDVPDTARKKRIPVSYKEWGKSSCVFSKILFLGQDQHDAPTWRKESSLSWGSSESNPVQVQVRIFYQRGTESHWKEPRKQAWDGRVANTWCFVYPIPPQPLFLEEMPRDGEIQISGCFHPRRWGERCWYSISDCCLPPASEGCWLPITLSLLHIKRTLRGIGESFQAQRSREG